jgi:signal transduction histidine kinase
VKVSFGTKLLASHAAVALVVSGLTLLVVDRVVTDRMKEQVDRRLEDHARSVPAWFERSGHKNRLAHRLSDVVGARVTFLNQDGVALGDSQAKPDPADRSAPEVTQARAGNIGRATRYSPVAQQEVRYIAVPGPDKTVIRLGLPIGEITDATEQIRRLILIGAALSFLLAMILAVFVARALSRRLRNATAMAERLGRGEWDLTDQQHRDLLTNIAHEIRTPVTSIRGYAETLAKGGADEETQREFLQTIHRNSLRIGQLVEDLLELEAIEGGTGRRLDNQPVRIADVVDSAVSTFRVQADRVHASIEVEVPRDEIANGDSEAIERIVLNLVGNALSYGGDGVAIHISSRRKGDALLLTVRDDGPGVTADQGQRIFERFFRGETGRSRDKGGSGLGLAIARQLAQAMNGSLYLTDSDKPGLSLTLELKTPRPARPGTVT